MKRIQGRIFRASITALVTAFAIQLQAQDIVIDSGTDETVISRLPSAPEQSYPVCYDTADGTLGPCNRVPLDFYFVSQTFEFEGTGFLSSRNVSCFEGDLAISAGYGHGQDPDVIVTAIGVSTTDPESVGIDFIAPNGENILLSLKATCVDYPPLEDDDP